jgi:hypothetical protein
MTRCWNRLDHIFGLLAATLVLVAASDAFGYSAIQNKADHTEVRVVPVPGKIVIDGDLKDWDMSGAILKFPPQGGAFYWIETDREKNETVGIPDGVASQPKAAYHYFQGGRYPHEVCQVQGAEWVRFGYAPYSETYPAGTPVCMCEGTGFDVDGFGRIFYPNLFCSGNC